MNSSKFVVCEAIIYHRRHVFHRNKIKLGTGDRHYMNKNSIVHGKKNDKRKPSTAVIDKNVNKSVNFSWTVFTLKLGIFGRRTT